MKAARTVLLAALAALAAASRAAAAEAPAVLLATIEQFDHLTLGSSVQVGSKTVTTGHLECRLDSGRAAPVLAGDTTVGFFFEGTGEMQYLSVDAIEAPLVTFNAKKGNSLKPEKTDKGVRLRDRFARMLWIAQGLPLPVLTGAAAAPLTDALAKQRQTFLRLP